jgi:hypothetical protein
MAFDYKNFADQLGLKDEDKTALFGLFEKNPEVIGKLEGLLSTQVSTQLAPLKAELEAKQRDLDSQFDVLSSIRGNDATAIAAAEARIEKLSSQVAVTTERLRRVATDNGLNADDILKDLALAPLPEKKTVDASAYDETKVLSAVNRSALAAFQNSVLMEDLADEHRTLFGKPMSRVELVNALQEEVKRTGNGNIGLREVFEKKFNVAGKREELREADTQRRIEDARKAERTAMADEYALRSTNQPLPQNENPSPIFTALKTDKPTHVAGVPEAVVASIASYRKIRSERHVA